MKLTKAVSLTVLLAFLFQSTIAMACKNYLTNHENISTAQDCHAASSAKQTKKETKPEEPECPVCELGLCIKSQAMISTELSLKSSKPQLVTTKPGQHSYVDWGTTSLTLHHPPPALTFVLQLNNWQSLYSVFII